MTINDLIKANELKQEINELELFIYYAESVWTGKIIKKEIKYILKSNPYGIFNSYEFEMNTKIKNKVLDVLRNYLIELKNQLENI